MSIQPVFVDMRIAMQQSPGMEQAFLANFERLFGGATGHEYRSALLSCYAEIKFDQYKQAKRMEDLEDAIRKGRQAVEETLEGQPALAVRSIILGEMFQSQFEQTGKLEDLDKAIQAAERALLSTPDRHQQLVERLRTLGGMFQCRFRETGQIDDLEKAMLKAEQEAEAAHRWHLLSHGMEPVESFAAPTTQVWFSEGTNRSAGTSVGPVVDEIIDRALTFFTSLNRSALVLYSIAISGGIHTALAMTDKSQPLPKGAAASIPPPKDFPNTAALCQGLVPGVGNHELALSEILRDLRRGWRKRLEIIGEPPRERFQRFWVSFKDGSERACDGFNRMEQRPFEDQSMDR